MNELKIVLEKSVYSARDTIYGAVYAKISQPTQATCITLRFQGYEHYYLSGLLIPDFDEDDKDRTLQESCEHVQPIELPLFTSTEPLPIRSFVFPFQLYLPADIPGSCHVRHDGGPLREMHTVYELLASLNDHRSTQVIKEVMVHQSPPYEYSLSVCKRHRISWFHRRFFAVEALVSKPKYCTKENIELTLDFRYTNTTDTHISSILVKLLRRVGLSVKRGEGTSKVLPLGEDLVLWENTLFTPSPQQRIDTIDRMLIPLPETLLPTTFGNYFTTRYYLSIVVTLNSSHSVSLELPVTLQMLPNASQTTCEPTWARECELRLTQHKAALSHDSIGFFRRHMPVLHSKLQETVVIID